MNKDIKIEVRSDIALNAVLIDASMDGIPKGSIEVPYPFMDSLITDLNNKWSDLVMEDMFGPEFEDGPEFEGWEARGADVSHAQVTTAPTASGGLILKDYADGCKGSWCIQRIHPAGYAEYWNESGGKGSWESVCTIYIHTEAVDKLKALEGPQTLRNALVDANKAIKLAWKDHAREPFMDYLVNARNLLQQVLGDE